jgi:cyclin A
MPSTLYHCVELVDRALSKITVAKEQLQCLGCACLFVACKFEETTVPPLEEFTYMAAESFTKKQLTDLELRVVEALSFRVSTVTAYNFLPRFTLAAGSRPRETALVHYLSELSLLHYEFLAFPPSIRAAAALYLSRQTLAASTPDPTRRAAEERNVWTPTIEYYTGYSPNTDLVLQSCVKLLRRAHAGAEWSTYEALKIKYTEPALLHVGEIACLEEGQLGF